MYLIPKLIWDGYLSRDIPDLWCGASHVDWWLTRASALIGAYESHDGFIDHLVPSGIRRLKARHEPYFRHNVRANIMRGPSEMVREFSSCRRACR